MRLPTSPSARPGSAAVRRGVGVRAARTLAFIAVLAGVWFVARASYRWWAVGAMGTVVCVEPVYDFGVQSPGTTVTHTFVLWNRGSRPVTVLSTKTDCSCSVADFDRSQPITPNASRELTVKVDTSGNYGLAQRNVVVTTDAPNSEPLRLRLQGTIEMPWLPPGKALEYEYPAEVARRNPQTQAFQLEARTSARDLSLRARPDTVPPYLKVESELRGDHVFDVRVTLDAAAPGRFSQELILETPGVKHTPYRLTVRGGITREFAAYPPKGNYILDSATTSLNCNYATMAVVLI